MSIRNVKVRPLTNVPPFRKVAIGTWSSPSDPQIYGTIEIDLSKAYEWRKKLPPDSPRITITHMIIRAIALAFERYPDLNGFIRFNKIYLRENVDISVLAMVQHESGREDLSSIKLEGVNRLGVIEIAKEMQAKVDELRNKKGTPLQKTSQVFGILPGILVGFLLRLTSFISYTLNIRFPGIPQDPFSGCLVTNVGMLGLDVAYAPLVPYTRAPLVILVGEAKKRPVVIDDRIDIRETVLINATIDHRFCDGALLAKMVKVIRQVFDEPDTYF